MAISPTLSSTLFNELVKLEKTKKLQIGTGDVELLLDKPIILGSGKGKAELYDKAIPSFMKKYGKKWNAKVYDDNIKQGPTVEMDSISTEKRKFGFDIPVTILEITPEMRKSVQQDGQALFSIFGLGGVGASVVSDSIKNNNISQTTN